MYCKNCGNILNDAADICQNCGFNQNDRGAYCPECSAKIEENANFCTNCGFNLTQQQAEQQPGFDKEQNSEQNYAPDNNAYYNGTYYTPPYNHGADNYTDYANNNEYYTNNNGQANQYNIYGNQKSRIAAGLLGIFLGCLGIHNFYLGYTSRAITQLLVSVLLSFTVIAPIAIAIWGLVEGIQILVGNVRTDANGVPLSD